MEILVTFLTQQAPPGGTYGCFPGKGSPLPEEPAKTLYYATRACCALSRNKPNHAVEAVGAAWRQMTGKLQFVKEIMNVEIQNGLGAFDRCRPQKR